MEIPNPKEFYNQNLGDRSSYEERADIYSGLTKPSIFREESWSPSSTKEDSYSQSFGAMGVNNFVSKVGMALFPPNSSAFKFSPDSEALAELTMGNDTVKQAIDTELATVQNNVTKYMEAKNTRVTAFRILDHLTVVSSCVLEKTKEGYKIHTLRSFVVKLNERGEEWAICVKEEVRDLPDGIEVSDKDKETYELHTLLFLDRDTDKWVMKQSVDGEIVGEEKTFTESNRPMAYVGWMWNQGDSYYRPYVEDYAEDLASLDVFSRVLKKGALISSKNITFVDERGGRTRIRDVRKAQNGGVIQGRAEDVTSYQHGKNYDYQVAIEAKTDIERRLSRAFLMTNYQVRDSERTTAYEVRMTEMENQNSLATVYAMASSKIIKRFVNWALEDLNVKFDAIDVEITTGLDALGRAAEAQKLDSYVSRASNMGFMDRLNAGELANRYASYDSIDTNGLLMSEQEFKKKQQEQMNAALAQQGGQSFANQAGANVANSVSQ